MCEYRLRKISPRLLVAPARIETAQTFPLDTAERLETENAGENKLVSTSICLLFGTLGKTWRPSVQVDDGSIAVPQSAVTVYQTSSFICRRRKVYCGRR